MFSPLTLLLCTTMLLLFLVVVMQLRIFGAGAANNLEEGNQERQQQQLVVNRRHRQRRQRPVAAAGAREDNVNRRNHNNNAVIHPPRNGDPGHQQRWMANGQHATWFQGRSPSRALLHVFPVLGWIIGLTLPILPRVFIGREGIHSMGHSLGSSSSDGPSSSSVKDPCGGSRMVKTFQAYLPECCHRTYSCVHCRAHLANHDELISKVLS